MWCFLVTITNVFHYPYLGRSGGVRDGAGLRVEAHGLGLRLPSQKCPRRGKDATAAFRAPAVGPLESDTGSK